MEPYVTKNDRFGLRKWNILDAPFLFALNNFPEAIKHTGDSAFESLAEAQNFISQYKNYDRDGYGRWLIVELKTGQPIGWNGLKKHDTFVDIGYRLHPNWWGKGIATETSSMVLEFGFTSLKLSEIVGRVTFENLASVRVLEKLGMKYSHGDLCHGSPAHIYKLKKEAFDLLKLNSGN